jgi:hypothetical protein
MPTKNQPEWKARTNYLETTPPSFYDLDVGWNLTIGKSELEWQARAITRYCLEHGDRWQPVPTEWLREQRWASCYRSHHMRECWLVELQKVRKPLPGPVDLFWREAPSWGEPRRWLQVRWPNGEVLGAGIADEDLKRFGDGRPTEYGCNLKARRDAEEHARLEEDAEWRGAGRPPESEWSQIYYANRHMRSALRHATAGRLLDAAEDLNRAADIRWPAARSRNDEDLDVAEWLIRAMHFSDPKTLHWLRYECRMPAYGSGLAQLATDPKYAVPFDRITHEEP